MTANRRRRTRAATPESQEALRDAIIDAARRIFRQGGHQAISMRKVALRVGCTAGALYRYFPDKQRLLLYVWEDEMRYLAEYVRGAIAQTEDPVNKVRQTFLAYMQFWEKRQDTFSTMFAPVTVNIDRSDTDDIFPTTGSNALYFDVRDLLASLLEGKSNAPADADLAMQCMLSAVHGILALRASASHFPWFHLQDMARVAIDGLLAGWGLIDSPATTAVATKRRRRPDERSRSRPEPDSAGG
jgi:AcrR family transcriptional regulator